MKTAIELLRVELILNSKQKHTESGNTSFTIGLSKFDELFKEAGKLEKQQIIKTRQDIFTTGNLTNEEYYNETFNN